MTRLPRAARPTAIALFVLALASCFAACAGSGAGSGDEELVVLAAASLSEVLDELAGAFEAENADARVLRNLAGSQTLATQILEGAPGDVFLSADADQMDRVSEAERVDEVREVAVNRLAILVPAGDPAGIGDVQGLALPDRSVVLAGADVPAGLYARDALRELGLLEAVMANVVSEEADVKGVVGKVVSGEADAGMAYATDRTSALADRLDLIELPEEATPHVRYLAARVQDAPSPELADAFLAFLGSEEAQRIFQEHGFTQP